MLVNNDILVHYAAWIWPPAGRNGWLFNLDTDLLINYGCARRLHQMINLISKTAGSKTSKLRITAFSRVEVSTAPFLKIKVFWVVMPCIC